METNEHLTILFRRGVELAGEENAILRAYNDNLYKQIVVMTEVIEVMKVALPFPEPVEEVEEVEDFTSDPRYPDAPPIDLQAGDKVYNCLMCQQPILDGGSRVVCSSCYGEKTLFNEQANGKEW